MRNDLALSKAVIPVGGLGTRLLPATKVLPKELLPVGRRPVVQYVVEEVRAAGLESICFVTGRKKALIQEHFDHDPELVHLLQDRGLDELMAELAYLESGLQLQYIRQSGPQGLADALGLAEDFAGRQSFAMALGDSIVCEPEMGTLLRHMIQTHLKAEADATLAVEPLIPNKSRGRTMVCPARGAAAGEDAFEVASVAKKPQAADTAGNWGIAARFVFSPAIFAALRRTRARRGGEVQLTDAISTLIQQGGRVLAVPLAPDQRRHDIGNFGGYFRAFLEFALTDPYYGDDVRGYLQELAARPDNAPADGSEQECSIVRTD